MQPESQTDRTFCVQELLQQREQRIQNSRPVQNKPTEEVSFDMEETADIVLPIDHPIFQKR